MAIGRTFCESLQKALRSMETGLTGLDEIAIPGAEEGDHGAIIASLGQPRPDRLLVIAEALRRGVGIDAVHRACAVDPWFLREIDAIVHAEAEVRAHGLPSDAPDLGRLKALGFGDRRLAALADTDEAAVAAKRAELGVHPVFKRIDTCAAEFESRTPYMYSCYETASGGRPPECEAEPSARRKVVILGGGPNRIGQGIEFDYCCVHAAYALKDAGFETIMVNCNPETVSTDYDTSDRLYFEPLTTETVLDIVRVEQSAGELVGLNIQFGGQTPLRLAKALEAAGVPILGTAPDAIDLAEDRERFRTLLGELGLRQPENETCTSSDGGARHRRAHRLSRRGPPLLRARRARHGDRQRQRGPRPLHAGRGFRLRRRAYPARPLPQGRHRGGRRCAGRRRERRRRRNPGAHRGGGDPLGRFRLLAAAAFAGARRRWTRSAARPWRWPARSTCAA